MVLASVMEKNGIDNFALTLEENKKTFEELNQDSTQVAIKADDNKKEDNGGRSIIYTIVSFLLRSLNRNPTISRILIYTFLNGAVLAYLIAATIHWYETGNGSLDFCDGFGLLLILVSVVYGTIIYFKFLKPVFLLWSEESELSSKKSSPLVLLIKWCSSRLFYTVPPVLFAIFLYYDTSNDRSRLTSLVGIGMILFTGFLFSKHPAHIRWDIIYRGILIQVVMALFSVRWNVGRNILQCLGQKIETFLSYSYIGADFVYGDNLVNQLSVFAFKCLSVIFFVNFLIEVLFYYEVLQRLFIKLGWALQKAMGTTAIESINCCVSVFLGVNEAMLAIKIYVKDLTMSELQAVLLGELSTVAGSVFAAYASFGVNPGYLITASIMSAPAALALSKLLYPETEVSRTSAETIQVDKSFKEKYSSGLSAACEGALSAIDIVQSIIAVLVAFISAMAFANATLSWFCGLLGYENVTLDVVIAKALIPVAIMIGIDPADSYLVAQLIATKAMINEFVAYEKLGKMKSNNLLSSRSEAIATYALCSFSNPGSVACMLAILSSVCRPKLESGTKLAFRAYIGGIVTCFMTASIAGLLISTDCYLIMAQTLSTTNTTNVTVS